MRGHKSPSLYDKVRALILEIKNSPFLTVGPTAIAEMISRNTASFGMLAKRPMAGNS